MVREAGEEEAMLPNGVADRRTSSSPSICFPPCGRSSLLIGNAFDLIVVQNEHEFAAGDAIFWFGVKFLKIGACDSGGSRIVLEVAQGKRSTVRFPIVDQKIQEPEPPLEYHPADGANVPKNRITRLSTNAARTEHDPTALSQLANLLESGVNSARYLLLDGDDYVLGVAPVNVFLWSTRDRLLVVDIDGTITRSNLRGVIDTILTEQYTYCHDGVCQFLSSIKNVRMLYLTSRPIGIANTTRKFLSQLRQAQSHQLPGGPLLGFTGSMAKVLLMELVSKSVHEFKREALTANVVRPFLQLGVRNVFLAGFGNSLMDMQAYHGAGMQMHQIYLVDKRSRIYCLDCKANREPLRNQDYMHARGTLFEGYQDSKLMAHILGQALIETFDTKPKLAASLKIV